MVSVLYSSNSAGQISMPSIYRPKPNPYGSDQDSRNYVAKVTRAASSRIEAAPRRPGHMFFYVYGSQLCEFAGGWTISPNGDYYEVNYYGPVQNPSEFQNFSLVRLADPGPYQAEPQNPYGGPSVTHSWARAAARAFVSGLFKGSPLTNLFSDQLTDLAGAAAGTVVDAAEAVASRIRDAWDLIRDNDGLINSNENNTREYCVILIGETVQPTTNVPGSPTFGLEVAVDLSTQNQVINNRYGDVLNDFSRHVSTTNQFPQKESFFDFVRALLDTVGRVAGLGSQLLDTFNSFITAAKEGIATFNEALDLVTDLMNLLRDLDIQVPVTADNQRVSVLIDDLTPEAIISSKQVLQPFFLLDPENPSSSSITDVLVNNPYPGTDPNVLLNTDNPWGI